MASGAALLLMTQPTIRREPRRPRFARVQAGRDSSMAPIDDLDLTGRTLGRYAVVAPIASGGQGRVYRGRDDFLRRDVAIKVLSRRGPADVMRRTLMAEARMLSRLNHRHVAGIYDVVTDAGCDFIVMEFVAGATLRDILAGGPLPPSEVLRLGAQIARGLASAHAASVVHRDVKPANLKITSSGEVKILDFGIARLLPGGALPDNATYTPCSDRVLGTIPYMAPEQLQGEEADERTDIFSIGVVLYEMATGSHPFPHRNVAAVVDGIRHEDPLPPSSVNPHVPLSLEYVINRAMQKHRRERYQSALELAAALEALMPHSSPEGAPAERRQFAEASAGGW
jgi:serine/threonine protein kinase